MKNKERKNLTLASLVTSGLLGCGSPETSSLEVMEIENPGYQTKVINGYQASFTDFPFVGALVSNAGTLEICTATFIRKDYVLTAAHCVEDGTPKDFVFILAGLDEICEEPCTTGLYKIAANEIYPGFIDGEWTSNWQDLAVILLKEEVSFVKPLPILEESEFKTALPPGNIVTICGYGYYYYEKFGKKERGPLNCAEVPIVSHTNEDEMLVGLHDPSAPNACKGDSGGPVLVYHKGKVQAAGIASRFNQEVDGYWSCGTGLIYTKPGRFIDWIEDTYQKLRSEFPLPIVEITDINISAEREAENTYVPLPVPVDQTDPELEEAEGDNKEAPLLVPSGGNSCSISNKVGSGINSLWPLLAFGLISLARRKKDLLVKI